jgi:hypothetical protein
MDDEPYTGESFEKDRPLTRFEQAFLRAHGAIAPLSTCPISWQPSALTPVFYGIREYSTADGAPAALRVFFPSLEGDVFTAPILDGCGRYPLILFAHGHCQGDMEHFRKWFLLPAQLARSGYVVAVPQLTQIAGGLHPSTVDHPDLAVLTNVLDWMRSGWEHQSVLLSTTGIAGHSYGALLSARVAGNANGHASLSGVWHDWLPPLPKPIFGLNIPLLFIQGATEFDVLSEGDWNALGEPRHRIVFDEGLHWDYLPVSQTPCSSLRGTCRHIASAAVDLVTMFFAKYVPPELSPHLPGKIPNSLVPPALVLTPEQEFYAGGHLVGYKLLAGKPECGHSLDWEARKRIVPHVRFLPPAAAAQEVRAVDLVPRFTGPQRPNSWVFRQNPSAGVEVDEGSTVRMLLSQGEIP